jgi:DNA ligase (NAD+)
MIGGDWTIFDGFGTEISREINDFDYSEADKIAAILDFSLPETKVESGQEAVAPAIQDKTFCITGKLKTFKNRDELKSDITSFGGKVTDSISSKTDYLINNDINSTSSKNNKAKQLGIPIISEEDYINLKNKQN